MKKLNPYQRFIAAQKKVAAAPVSAPVAAVEDPTPASVEVETVKEAPVLEATVEFNHEALESTYTPKKKKRHRDSENN